MTKMIRGKRPPFRRGVTTVEFALTVPILFAFVLGAFEFGRANMLQHTAQNAAYEGARSAIVPGATAEGAVAVANSILSIVGVQDATVTITPNVLDSGDDEVTVAISVSMDTNSYLAPLFLAGRSLQASCTLSREDTAL